MGLIYECTVVYQNSFIVYFVSDCAIIIRLQSGCFGNLIMVRHLIWRLS
jgi:hypothetical protein